MIYYVEDDASIRELVVYALERAGLKARGFEDGNGFAALCAKERPEMALLDVMLPGDDGVKILSDLKANPLTRDIPVIMLTARGAEYDKVVSLDGGADDYLVKPFGMMELVSRVRAVLRRARPEEASRAVFSVGPITMDEDARKVEVDGQEVHLTFKEYELLKCLIARPGVARTRDALLDRVWGYDYEGGTRTVDVHIQTLRQKLGAAGEWVETVRGVGYRMGGQ